MHVHTMQPVGISLPQSQLAGVIGQCILYGSHIVISAMALFLLIVKRERNTVTAALIGITVLMFAVSTMYLGLVTNWTLEDYVWQDMVESGETVTVRKSHVWVPLALAFLNSLIGDLITMWRAWILWDRDSRMLIFPILLWTATFATGVADCYASAVDAALTPLSPSSRSSLLCLTFQLLTFFTNVSAVALIGFRYWIYRQQVIDLGFQFVRHKAVFLLIIESGALYCGSWLALALVYISTSNGVYVILQLITQLTGIYPTLTIVLICLKLTHEDAVQNLKYKNAEPGEVAIVHHRFQDRVPRFPPRERPRLPELSMISNLHLDWRASTLAKHYSICSASGFRFGQVSPLSNAATQRTEYTPPPSSWRKNHAISPSAGFRPTHRPSHSTMHRPSHSTLPRPSFSTAHRPSHSTHRPEWRTSSIIRHYSSFSSFYQGHHSSHSHSTSCHARQEWRTSSIIRHYSSYSTNFRSLA